jgi:hypothetical protein
VGVALALLGVACGRAPEQAGRVRALVAPPHKDTIRFEAPARAKRCSGGTGSAGLLVQGSSEGNGVVVWLRGSGADALGGGPWPLLQRGDTVSLRGASVGVRYITKEVAHGFALDSGAVDVRDAGGVITVVVRGTGLETMAAGRVALEASFDAVPLEADTASCRSTS